MFRIFALLLLVCYATVSSADAIILLSSDSGLTWTTEASNCNNNLNDVARQFGPNGSAVAVGDNGTILRRDGTSGEWQNVSPPNLYDDLYSIMYQVNCNTFWVGGENGRIVYSTDSGLTWQTAPSAPFDINCLWLDTTGGPVFVCGDNGAVYSNGWISSGTTEDLYAFAGHCCQASPKWVFGNSGACRALQSGVPSYEVENVAFRGAVRFAGGSSPEIAVGNRGSIYRFDYNNNIWPVFSGTTANLYAVSYCLSSFHPETHILM